MRPIQPNFRYLLYFCGARVIYGCTSKIKDNAIDWGSINYTKLSCNDEKNKSSLCKQNDDDISSIAKGKR